MKKLFGLVVIFLSIFVVSSCKVNGYNADDLWCIRELDKDLGVYNTDTFFVAPTAGSGAEGVYSLEYTDTKNMSKFLGATKMEKGIYDEKTRFFAPYYHQALFNLYDIDDKVERDKYLNSAYSDVKEAFEYYLANYNMGNKIILAGFSQGADMCLRLLKDYVNNSGFYNRFIACYAIGWIVTDDYLNSNSKLKFANGETDQKVIISFNSESIDCESTFIVGENEKTHSINPLNWKTDSTVADKTLNKGAVFLNTYGDVVKEEANFTGCYVDSVRGTLKMTDVDKATYNLGSNPKTAFMGDGSYHTYDYQFFYNNLKDNVNKRIQNSNYNF